MILYKSRQLNLCIKYNKIYSIHIKFAKCFSSITKPPVKLEYSSFSNINTDFRREPLILMHGLFGYKKNFESIAKALIHKIPNQIYTVDMRNHGASARSADMSYEAMSRDVEMLVRDQLNIDTAYVLGHSMGGKIAMMLALTQPSLVAKLIVVDITPCSMKREDSGKFASFVSAINDLDLNSMGATLMAVKQQVDRSLSTIMPEKAVRLFIMSNVVKKNNKFDWRFNISAINRHLSELMTFPKITEGVTYDGTTKFIGGDKSPYITFDKRSYITNDMSFTFMQHNISNTAPIFDISSYRESSMPEIQRLFPFSEVEKVKDAGHWVHSEKPYEFIDIVTKFLNGE